MTGKHASGIISRGHASKLRHITSLQCFTGSGARGRKLNPTLRLRHICSYPQAASTPILASAPASGGLWGKYHRGLAAGTIVFTVQRQTGGRVDAGALERHLFATARLSTGHGVMIGRSTPHPVPLPAISPWRDCNLWWPHPQAYAAGEGTMLHALRLIQAFVLPRGQDEGRGAP